MALLWYAVRLLPRLENTAIALLDEQKFDPYYPKMHVAKARGGRITDAVEPVFPGYLFVRSEDEPAAWRTVNSTRGVLRLLGFGPDGVPCPLREGEIESLQRRERSGQLRHPTRRRIRVGDQVEFKHGSLLGHIGLVNMIRRQRIQVLLSMFGGATLVQTPRDWLRLAEASKGLERVVV